MNNIEQLKQIILNAPEGATHVSNNGVYYQKSKQQGLGALVWWRRGEEWIESKIDHITRSLSDIKTIVELEEQKRSFAAAFYECYDELRDLVNMQQGNPHVHNAEKIVYNLAVKFDDANELMP